MLKLRQLVTVLTLSLILGSLFFVFSPVVARSQPTTPTARGLEVVATALMEREDAPLAGVSVFGDYAFVGGQSSGYYSTERQGIRIVNLSDPDNPELVGRIPLRTRAPLEDHSHGDAVVTHMDTEFFQGDIAVVLQGVPDSFTPEVYPQPYGIWDVTDVRNPEFLSIVSFGTVHGKEGGQLGDKPKDTHAVVGNYFYALYDTDPGPIPDISIHFAVVDISDPRNPLVVGDWQDNSQVAILGMSVNEAGTRAYLTGSYPHPWGFSARDGYVYILDIENPSQPTEIGRYVFPLRGRPSSMSTAAPNDDGSLLVFADHSWQPGAWGILHILDTSDLATIHEISSFAIKESDSGGLYRSGKLFIATDMALKGNLIFSTWLNGGMRVIDISDPTRPVQVGSFLDTDAPPLSDVALKGDLIVATAVWAEGLYIFRLTDEVPTVVIDETVSVRVSVGEFDAFPGFHISWEWPDGTRESAWNGFLNISGFDYRIQEDGWVYVWSNQRDGPPFPVEKVNLTVTGVYTWGVTSFVMEAEAPHAIFDRVKIFLEAARVDIGSTIGWSAFYEYDGQPFLGEITVVGESNRIGKFNHTVQAISDPLYGIEIFSSNRVEVIYDRVEVTLVADTLAVSVGEAAQMRVEASYAYDGTPFQGSVVLSNELIQSEAGTYSYTVLSIEDTAYGLTVFSSNTVEVTFFVPPFYAQPSFLLVLLTIASAAGVAVFLFRRRRRRLKGAEARVDRVRL